MPSMTVKIAVYSICLNEAKHVERWLKATEDADVRVVADTGSTDGTVDMLREAGVAVSSISVKPWRFDVARNAALALVPEDVDVCLILDMDEVPEKDFFDKVRKAYKPEYTRGWIRLHTHNEWSANRLHSRHGYLWIRPCHEVAVPYGGTEQVHFEVNAHIYHEPDAEKSRKHYLDLLLMAVEENPEDARMWTYLVREYYFNRNWTQLLAAGEQALELGGWDVERAAIYRWMADAAHELGKIETGIELCKKGIEELPLEPEPWFHLAHHYYMAERWQELVETVEECLRKPSPTHYLVDQTILKWRAADLGCNGYNKLGDLKKALKMGRRALKGNPTDPRLKNNVMFIEKEINESAQKNRSSGRS